MTIITCNGRRGIKKYFKCRGKEKNEKRRRREK